MISVSSTGPSGTKADYSNYGLGDVEVSAPGGWFRDFVGTPTSRRPENLVLSSYPLDVAIDEGWPTPAAADRRLLGERLRAGRVRLLHVPAGHLDGVAARRRRLALIVQAHGRGNGRRGFSLDPDTVRTILETTATDHACPAGGVEIYTDEGRPAEFNAVCEGTTADNGLYGEGIVNAIAAVARNRR